MRNYVWILLGGLTLVHRAQSATLKISEVQSSRGELSVSASLRSAPATEMNFQILSPTGESLSAEMQSAPMNLWILVDTSSLCRAFRMDRYLDKLFEKLPKLLSPQTRVSLVTYNAETRTSLLSQTAPEALRQAQVNCREGILSASYEASLRQLMQEENEMNLPKQAWIFSSGNLNLSHEAVQEIRERKVDLSLTLYVPLVFGEVQPILAAQSKSLNEQMFYSVLKQEANASVLIPDMRFFLSFSPPRSAEGATASYRLIVKSKDAEGDSLASASFQALAARSWLTQVLQSRVFQLLALMVVLYLTVRTIRAYFPKRCTSCKRLMSFEYSQCLFCHNKNEASLLVSESRPKDAVQEREIFQIPLRQEEALVSMKRYGPGTGTAKRKALFSIRRRSHNGKEFYLLSRGRKSQGIYLNGRPLVSDTYLATGDRLQVDSFEMTFLTGDRK